MRRKECHLAGDHAEPGSTGRTRLDHPLTLNEAGPNVIGGAAKIDVHWLTGGRIKDQDRCVGGDVQVMAHRASHLDELTLRNRDPTVKRNNRTLNRHHE